jgi:hypothetical protein
VAGESSYWKLCTLLTLLAYTALIYDATVWQPRLLRTRREGSEHEGGGTRWELIPRGTGRGFRYRLRWLRRWQ